MWASLGCCSNFPGVCLRVSPDRLPTSPSIPVLVLFPGWSGRSPGMWYFSTLCFLCDPDWVSPLASTPALFHAGSKVSEVLQTKRPPGTRGVPRCSVYLPSKVYPEGKAPKGGKASYRYNHIFRNGEMLCLSPHRPVPVARQTFFVFQAVEKAQRGETPRSAILKPTLYFVHI